MKRIAFLISLPTAILFCGTNVLGEDPEYYSRKDSWQETVRVSREALLEQLNKPEKPETAVKPQLGAWYVNGPYTDTNALSKVFAPEKRINLSDSKGKLKWKQIKVNDGSVHRLKLPDNSATYFYRKITASRPLSIISYYGSDDGIIVWLNGQKVLSNKANRGVGADQETAQLNLQKGENHLLIKIWNGAGASGWYFSTTKNSRRAGMAFYCSRRQ